ncbi:MAG: hypothetical protein HC935_05810, partial [Pseudanabaena sp. SU_2_4]|nr:hypothetical protein [Pseudanabaena sp. SU_2_4]
FAVDELFELEALGFDLNDAEEEDNYALQGIAASDRMYNISSDEVSEPTQAQPEIQESTDNDLGMSDFFSEEANELLGEPVSASEDLGLSATSGDAVTQMELGNDFLQLEDMDLDENAFALDPGSTNSTDVNTDSSEASLDWISGDRDDLDFQLDLGVSNDDVADLFAVQDAGESSLRSENNPDDANTEEIADFLDLFDAAETSEFTSAESTGELLDIAVPQQEDDASVLDDLMLDDAGSASNDVDLDNLFSDADNLPRNDLSASGLNNSDEILNVGSLDTSQSDADFVDFNKILDFGGESNDSLPVDEIQQFAALEPTEQLTVENTAELVESSHPRDIEALVSNLPDVAFTTGLGSDDYDDYSYAGEGDTETVFLDDIEDLVGHHSGLTGVTLRTEPPQLEIALDPHPDLTEVDTVLQDKVDVPELADFSQDPAVESSDRDLPESVISEDPAENMSFGESANSSNTGLPDLVQNDVDRLVWEEPLDENVASLPVEDFANAPQTNVPLGDTPNMMSCN